MSKKVKKTGKKQSSDASASTEKRTEKPKQSTKTEKGADAKGGSQKKGTEAKKGTSQKTTKPATSSSTISRPFKDEDIQTIADKGLDALMEAIEEVSADIDKDWPNVKKNATAARRVRTASSELAKLYKEFRTASNNHHKK